MKIIEKENFSNYQIYEDGYVFSVQKCRFLKMSKNNSGYKNVTLYDDNKVKHVFLCHKLVYETFNNVIVEKGYDVDHINNDKNNNNLSNLQILTHKENCLKKFNK